MLNQLSYTGQSYSFYSCVVHYIDGCLGCFNLLAIMNKDSVNICVKVFVKINFYFCWVIPRCGIAELLTMVNCK